MDGVGERFELDERVASERDNRRFGDRNLFRQRGHKRAFRHGNVRRAKHHDQSGRCGDAQLYFPGQSHFRGHDCSQRGFDHVQGQCQPERL